MFTLRKLFFIYLLRCATSSYSEEKRLREDIFSNYSKDIRPVLNINDPTGIRAHLIVFAVLNLNMDTGYLVTRSGIRLTWKDELLNWKPENYGNISEINIYSDKVWMPNVFACNSHEEANKHGENTYELVLYSNGTIGFWRSKIIQTFCDIDVYAFPFDRQLCYIWLCVEDQEKLHVQFNSFHYNIIMLEENYHWDIDFEGIKDGLNHPYISAPMYLTRKLKISSLATIIPLAVLSILTVCIFVLPPESGEKVSLATTIFLTNVVYMVEMDRMLSANSKNPSLLILYLIALTLCSGIFTLGAIVICKMHVLSEQNSNNEQSGNGNDCVTFTKKSGPIDLEDKLTSDLDIASGKSKTLKNKTLRCCGYRRLDNILLCFSCVIFVILPVIFACYFTVRFD